MHFALVGTARRAVLGRRRRRSRSGFQPLPQKRKAAGSRFYFLLAAQIAALQCAVFAAEPTLTHLFPAAGQQGTTVSVTASGKFDPWPPKVWVDAPGIEFQPSKTKAKFDVRIAQDAAPGPHLVRIFNEAGASQPRFFIVSTEPETLEVEPNNDFKSPQKIASLPATISGKLDKPGDVDSFGITLKKGQTLSAWVEAYVLASTFDGMLRIVDTHGNELAFNHDGRTLDPDFAWPAPYDGDFVIQLMGFAYPANASVDFTGGEGCVYRLHLTTAPRARVQFPPHEAGDGPEIREQEPNDSRDTAQQIALPCVVSGCIDKPGDLDCFAFTAEKQKSYTLEICSARAGAPLDSWLTIQNKDGRELKRNDDAAGSKDSQLTWTAPGDGVFYALVGDVTHHGGPEYLYQLRVAEATPAVTATSAAHEVIVPAGQKGEIKTTVKFLNGFKTKLQLMAKNLPEGVTAPPVDVPEKGGDVVLKFEAAAEAEPASQPIQVVLHEVESGSEHPVIYALNSTSETNGVPQGYSELVVNSTGQLWLTVGASAKKTGAAK